MGHSDRSSDVRVVLTGAGFENNASAGSLVRVATIAKTPEFRKNAPESNVVFNVML
jgi:hypothetical protein